MKQKEIVGPNIAQKAGLLEKSNIELNHEAHEGTRSYEEIKATNREP